MFAGMTYGTFILFGLLILMGGGFIWWFFPETKVSLSQSAHVVTNPVPNILPQGLSLEEMDIIFGSQGVAAADTERMREIAREVGLEQAVRSLSVTGAGYEGYDEKNAVADHKDSGSH